jgi:hypothetical protein
LIFQGYIVGVNFGAEKFTEKHQIMSDYVTVYDIASEGMNFHWLISVPFILIGVGLILYEIRIEKQYFSPKIVFGLIFALFASYWGYEVGHSQIESYNSVRKTLREKTYLTVSGDIENFDPMPAGGHKYESFEVKGVRFEYSDFEIIEGFHNTCSHGGPICENGQIVEINYVTINNRNFIIKLRINTNANK